MRDNGAVTNADRVYLDHAATSPLSRAAATAMATTPPLGNPSATHGSGRRAAALLEDAREEIAALLGVSPLEVVFTSGGTEADSLAVTGALSDGGRAWVSAVEHPAVAGLADPLLLGERVRVLPVDGDGHVDPDRVSPSAGDVVSVMTVNNETGVVQPVAECAERARRAGALMHTDAVQALGHLPLDPRGWGVDLMSLSAHKIAGPVGIGALWVRRGVRVHPLVAGGGQQQGVRPGTQTVMLARGFAAALAEALDELDERMDRWDRLRRRLVEGLARIEGIGVDGHDQAGPDQSAAICHLTVEGVRSADLLVLLDRDGIDASAGSACQAGVSRPSTVMLAMGRSRAEASAGLRISFGPHTDEADVDAVLSSLPEAVSRARAAR